MKIVGCSGQLASGKDTIADYLYSRLEGNWKRTSFATAVKKIFMDTFGVDAEFVEHWKRIPEPPPGFLKNVRDCLTFIGDGFRTMQRDVWMDIAFRDKEVGHVLSDVRYLSEVDYIRNNSGVTILIWRPGHENSMDNASEQELMPFVRMMQGQPDGEVGLEGVPFDLWIVNDGTLEELHHKVEDIIIPYVKKHV